MSVEVVCRHCGETFSGRNEKDTHFLNNETGKTWLASDESGWPVPCHGTKAVPVRRRQKIRDYLSPTKGEDHEHGRAESFKGSAIGQRDPKDHN
jgi:CO dehydrogenase/acetyl-CoA synthase alpha subunit